VAQRKNFPVCKLAVGFCDTGDKAGGTDDRCAGAARGISHVKTLRLQVYMASEAISGEHRGDIPSDIALHVVGVCAFGRSPCKHVVGICDTGTHV
jgi:hypothetical protein